MVLDALSSLSAGELIYNSTTSKLEVYNGSSWDAVATGSAGASLGLVVALS